MSGQVEGDAGGRAADAAAGFRGEGVGARMTARARRLLTRANWNVLVETVRADFKVTDHNTILGVLWSLLNPVLLLAVLYFIFRSHFGHQVDAYPLFLLLGIVLVSFFVTATTRMITLFSTNQPLILNTTVPRETLVISHIAVQVYNLLVQLALCIAVSLVSGLCSPGRLIAAVPLLVAFLGLVVGVGLTGGLVHCFARDVVHIWTLLSRLLFLATPIFYSLDSVGPAARTLLYWLNPLVPFLLALRATFMNNAAFDPVTYCHALGLGVAVLGLGYGAFLVLEQTAVEQA